MAEENEGVEGRIGWWIMNGFCWLCLFSGLYLAIGGSGGRFSSRSADVIAGVLMSGAAVLGIRCFRK
jgi:hypothetical protein